MQQWTPQVARLGAELGPAPADALIPTAAEVLAWVAVEGTDDDDLAGADPDVAAAVAALHRLLGRTPRPWCGPALDAALAGLDPVLAPVQAVRLAAAVAAGLLAGHLPPGQPWSLHVEDQVGAAGPALGPVLDLLAGLLDGWDPTAAPPTVTTNLGSLRRAGTGYEPSDERLTTVPDLWVELDPWGPGGAAAAGRWMTEHDHGPPPGRDAPAVVVRPAPAGATDPGPPPAPGAPPNPGPALAAGARWCFASTGGDDVDRQRAQVAGLLDPAGPAITRDSEAWPREAADLLLAADPHRAEGWCHRALVEAGHPAGSRARHARLVEAAAQTGAAGAALRAHAGHLGAAGRPSWALDVWAVADAALQDQLVADAVHEPGDRHIGELALTLAARLEAAAIRSRLLVPSQTEG